MAGDGLQQLYESSYRRLVAQLATYTGDTAEAEDLVQEAFARAVGRWSQLESYEHPEAWLRTVAMNLARSRWRRGTRTAAVMLRLRASHEDTAPPSPDHVALVSAMKTLPHAQREALVLFHVADLSVEDIARQTGVPSGTVKARLSRGRSALATQLADRDPAAAALAQRAPRGPRVLADPEPPAPAGDAAAAAAAADTEHTGRTEPAEAAPAPPRHGNGSAGQVAS